MTISPVFGDQDVSGSHLIPLKDEEDWEIEKIAFGCSHDIDQMTDGGVLSILMIASQRCSDMRC